MAYTLENLYMMIADIDPIKLRYLVDNGIDVSMEYPDLKDQILSYSEIIRFYLYVKRFDMEKEITVNKFLEKTVNKNPQVTRILSSMEGRTWLNKQLEELKDLLRKV